MIATLATGATAYGGMAFNLMASLRANLPNERLVVITDGVFQKFQGYQALGVEIIQVAQGVNPFAIKTQLRDILGATRFIFIDADTVVTNADLLPGFIAAAKKAKLLVQVLGELKGPTRHPEAWGTESMLRDHYKLKRSIPVLQSSIIANGSAGWWKAAQKAYGDPCPLAYKIAGHFPDEVAFSVACAKTGRYPDEAGQYITFPSAGKPSAMPFMTLAGSRHRTPYLAAYNAFSQKWAKQLGVRPFKVRSRDKIAWNRN